MTRDLWRALHNFCINMTSRSSFNAGQWTTARFKSFVISALRTATRRWPPKFEALRNAFTIRKTNQKTGKLAQHFKCAACSNEFVAKDVQVDHIEPVVDPKSGFQTWDNYIDRMFCEAFNFQVLCKPCHAEKTAAEKQLRNQKDE